MTTFACGRRAKLPLFSIETEFPFLESNHDQPETLL
jgi:hypothetical protein